MCVDHVILSRVKSSPQSTKKTCKRAVAGEHLNPFGNGNNRLEVGANGDTVPNRTGEGKLVI
jgi:hypothetical protein